MTEETPTKGQWREIVRPGSGNMAMEEPLDIALEELIETPDWEGRAQSILLLVISVFLLVLAVPLLIILLIKSPQTWQDVSLAGISFQKLLFLFLLSAAVTAYSSVFFLKARPLTILIVFALSLFCCFPIIVGLKNNLTLHQAITDGPFFQGWPYFLRPAYLLIEFLVPAAIVVYLYLQVKAIISGRPHRYTFFVAATYLIIAAFFGFSALQQAKQPNIYSALVLLRDSKVGVVSTEKRQSPLLKVEGPAGRQNAPVATPPAEGAMNAPSPTKPGSNGFEQKLQVLTEKVDRILVLLDREKSSQTGHSEQVPGTTAEVREAPAAKPQTVAPLGPTPDSPPAAEALHAETAAVPALSVEEEFSPKVRELSDKVDLILETLTQVDKLTSAKQDNPPAGKVVIQDKQPAESAPPQTLREPPADQRAREDINGKIQAISAKIDRMLQALARMESRLNGH